MATAKGQHYATELDLARRLHLFELAHPADYKGRVSLNRIDMVDGMDWKELVRKFKKHTARELTGQAALTEQQLVYNLSEEINDLEAASAAAEIPALPRLAGSHVSSIKASLASLASLIDSSSAGSTPTDLNSARIIHAYGLFLTRSYVEAKAVLAQVSADQDENNGEMYPYTLRVLGGLLVAHVMSQDSSCSDSEIGDAYSRASAIFDESLDLVGINQSKARTSPTIDWGLLAVGEEAIRRWALWASKAGKYQKSLQAYKLYLKHAATWPATFRVQQRISTHSNLRTLLNQLLPTSTTIEADTNSWHELTALNNTLQEPLVRHTTSLPRACEVNVQYVKFFNSVVDNWRAGGERRGVLSVIEILQNATSHTFQSQSLLRHLVYTLTIATQYEEAEQALNLYYELFTKTRETDATQVAKDIYRLSRRAEKTNLSEEKALNEKESGEEVVDLPSDIDSDRDFVMTIIHGARVLGKYLNKHQEGLDMIEFAYITFNETKDSTLAQDAIVKGHLERVKGLLLAGVSKSEQSTPPLPPPSLTSAYTHLVKSVELSPSWINHLSLALVSFSLGHLEESLEHAKTAISINESRKEGWIVLGQVLSAQNNWLDALGIFEGGMDLETSSRKSEFGEEEKQGMPEVSVNDKPDLVGDELNFPINSLDVLELDIRIRIMRNKVLEVLEGPNSALEDQRVILGEFGRQVTRLQNNPFVQELMIFSKNNKLTHSSAFSIGSSSTAPAAGVVGTNGLPVDAGIRKGKRGTKTSRASVGTISLVSLADSTTSLGTVSPKPNANTLDLDSHPKIVKMLVDLWLLSAASYRRIGNFEDCRGALREAEKLNAEDADVWVQLALYYLGLNKPENARTCAIKALVFDTEHIGASVILARLYLDLPKEIKKDSVWKTPFADGLLQVTRRKGWDVPEAWFELSRCMKEYGRPEQELACLKRAKELVEVRGIHNLLLWV